MDGTCNGTFFSARPLRSWSRDQISLNFNCKDNFKYFQTKLCAFVQMKDIKYIRQDFRSAA